MTPKTYQCPICKEIVESFVGELYCRCSKCGCVMNDVKPKYSLNKRLEGLQSKIIKKVGKCRK